MEKGREFQKNIDFCSIDYAKAFDCVGLTNCAKFLREMEVPDHLTYLLRKSYLSEETAVRRTRHGTMYWFKTGK